MARQEVSLLSGSTYVAAGPTNVGLFAPGDGRAILIDSGNDDEAGRGLLRACEAAELRISHILNTHSNADHCGGNSFLQSRTQCRIAAPRVEAAFIENPILEPALLWGGFPVPPLRNKFLVSKASRVTDLLEPPCLVPDTGIEALPLPGHFLGMAGYMTPDGVLFCADAGASPEILAKYSFYFVYDVSAHLGTLDSLAGIGAEWFVPSHAAPTRDIRSFVDANKAKVLEVGERILGLCAVPATAEGLLTLLADSYGLLLNHTQYALLGSTLRSYLAWLADTGAIASRIEGNRLLFERK